MPFDLQNNATSCQPNPTILGNSPVLIASSTPGTGTGLTPAQLILLNSALQNEVDPTAVKKAGLTAGKLLVSGLSAGTTGAVVESTISQTVLEAQLAATYANPLTLDARITAMETTQNDVKVVAALPTTGQLLDVLYVVSAGVNKDKSFYWDGTQWNQADKDIQTFATSAAFPATGIDGVLYISKTGTTKGAYYWDGTLYQPTASVTAPLPTTNAIVLSKTLGIKSTVNTVDAIQAIPAGVIVDKLGFNATGDPVYQAIPVPEFLTVTPILPGASLTFTHNANNEFCPLVLMVKDITNGSPRVDMALGTNAINENIRVVRTANTVVITNLDPVNTIEVDGRAN